MAKSTTFTAKLIGNGQIRYDVAYEADASDGSIDPLNIPVAPGLLAHYVHNPGATPATSGFVVALKDKDTGVDALCGGGAITTTAGADDWGGPIPNGSNISPVPVGGSLDFAATGNSVNSAVGVFSFYVLPLG